MSLTHIHFETQSDMEFVSEWIHLVEKGALNASLFLFIYDFIMHVQPIQFTKPFNIKCYYGNAKHKQHKTFPMCSNITKYINKITHSWMKMIQGHYNGQLPIG